MDAAIGKELGLPMPMEAKPTIHDLEAILEGPSPEVEIMPSGELVAVMPHYTTSLDAALTLVEPEYHWTVGGPKRPAALCFDPEDVDVLCEWHGAATPALALVIACLRARG